ncbi:MAG: cation transporter [Anaerolineales bacterium]
MSLFRSSTLSDKYRTMALLLGLFTVFYNLVEGLVSMYFGASDETIALFGFGVDSFIEVMSGIGIVAMILRIRRNPDALRSKFEQTALRITGTAFYLLALGLTITIVVNLITAHKPETTVPGTIISIISIVVMLWLVTAKRKIGRALNSAPILADANCTMTCVSMSLVLPIASLMYHLTGLGFIDSLGAAGLVYFSYREGREAFEKATGMECGCGADLCEG